MTEPNLDPTKLPVSVLIIARDEEINLPDALHSVVRWVEQVVLVLDPRTTDRSREVARELGADVVEHPFETHAAQRAWALGSGVLSQPWILILDADERVSPDLRRHIAAAIDRPDARDAYAVRFRFIFYGRWIKHCWYGTWVIRLWRANAARYEQRSVHEHVVVDGPIGYLDGDIIHNDFKGMDAWIEKHNRYATLEADQLVRGHDENRLTGRLFGSRVERRRFLKDRLWDRLPFRPVWMFVYLYFVRLGVLDGALGFRFCVMHAIFDGFTTVKVWEARWVARHPARNYYRALLEDDLGAHPHDRVFYSE
jgi:glycosyltransferase involved in cell wall biosynthesis